MKHFYTLSSFTQRKEMRQKMCADTLAELQLSNQRTEGYVFTALGAGFWALRQSDFRTAIQEIIMQVYHVMCLSTDNNKIIR